MSNFVSYQFYVPCFVFSQPVDVDTQMENILVQVAGPSDASPEIIETLKSFSLRSVSYATPRTLFDSERRILAVR